MEGLFLKVFNMSVTAGYVILAVLLIRMILRRAPKKYAYLLWSVVLFRLVCPVSFASAISIFGAKPFNMTAAQSPSAAGLTYVPADIGLMSEPKVTIGIPTANRLLSESLPAAAPAASANPLQVWLTAAAVLWCAGIALLLIYGAVSFISVKRGMSNAVLLSGRVRQSDRIRSPFVLGFINPTIYIPFGLSGGERDYILSHEEYHLKRFDHLIKPLAFLVLTVHWFNPLVWLSYALMSRDMEMSCDEHVLSVGKGFNAAAYSTSLLSFAANRRFRAAGPLCFGESGVRVRIKNALRWKRPGLWLTAVASLLCVLVIAACAANPRQSGVAAERGMPTGNYAFESQVYMNPLSSFIAFDGYTEYYTFDDNTFTVTRESGAQEQYAITPEEAEFDEQAFESDFIMDLGKADISGYKDRAQYNLKGSEYRIYRMDDEVWLARVHSGGTSEQKSEYIWSIYQIAPYGGELPQMLPSPSESSPPEPSQASSTPPGAGAKADALSLLDKIFQNGAHIRYADMDTLGRSFTPTTRDFELESSRYLERYQVLFNCDWEKSDTLRTPGAGDVCLVLEDNDSGFYFFPGSDEVTLMTGGQASATWRAGGESGSLPDVVLSEFSGYEADYKNVSVHDEGFKSFEEAASAYMEAYGDYLRNLTPENIARITDLKVLSLEVYLTREGDDDIFGFRTEFALKPVIYDTAAWWAGNTQAGTGELEGFLTMYRELRLERTDGVWRCTDMGTGGLSLD